jgi:hypothetical protein
MDKPALFHMLSHEEFGKLSSEQKIAYLAAAMEAVRNNVPIIGVAASEYPAPKKGEGE